MVGTEPNRKRQQVEYESSAQLLRAKFQHPWISSNLVSRYRWLIRSILKWCQHGWAYNMYNFSGHSFWVQYSVNNHAFVVLTILRFHVLSWKRTCGKTPMMQRGKNKVISLAWMREPWRTPQPSETMAGFLQVPGKILASPWASPWEDSCKPLGGPMATPRVCGLDTWSRNSTWINRRKNQSACDRYRTSATKQCNAMQNNSCRFDSNLDIIARHNFRSSILGQLMNAWEKEHKRR